MRHFTHRPSATRGDTEIVIQAQEPLHGKHQFVACKQSIFVGHIEYSRAKHTITWLWVNEDYRGNGIGKELFTAAINDLRPLCSQVTWLSTQDAIPFYQAMGATISERRKEDPAHLTRMSINT